MQPISKKQRSKFINTFTFYSSEWNGRFIPTCCADFLEICSTDYIHYDFLRQMRRVLESNNFSTLLQNHEMRTISYHADGEQNTEKKNNRKRLHFIISITNIIGIRFPANAQRLMISMSITSHLYMIISMIIVHTNYSNKQKYFTLILITGFISVFICMCYWMRKVQRFVFFLH